MYTLSYTQLQQLRKLFLLVLGILAILLLNAQGMQKRVDLDEVPVFTFTRPAVEEAMAADSIFGEPGMPYRIGIGQSIDIDVSRDGQKTLRPDGSSLVRMGISMPGANAIILYFDEFYIAEGNRLTLTDKNHNILTSPLTAEHNPTKSNYYSSGLLRGDTVYLHFESAGPADNSRLHIYESGFVYKNVFPVEAGNATSSGNCQVNVICSPEGDSWQDEKRGVARMLIKIGSQYYLCSGSLVNNTSQDCTPYFLSADHCGSGASANDLNQWVFYFNYEGLLCSSSSPYTTSNQVVGATKKASAANNIGSKSDMLLLELNQQVPEAYQAYFNGWDRNNVPSGSGTGIHHPAGDIKKISTYTSSLSDYFNTHWEVSWVATTNGHGTTEGGSSGSPIFNSNGQIVGTLTGGYSSCTQTGSPDYYGKFSYHWTSNGSLASQQLEPWLDPGNTNLTTLPGKYCNYLNAEFMASATSIFAGDSVSFTDLSSGSPLSWSWSLPGAQPDTSNLQDPSVIYPNPGIYDVSLTISDGSGSSTEHKAAYIIVSDPAQTGCDTLAWPLSGTPVLYTVTGNGGYVCGTNIYNDLAKAEYFSGTDTTKTIYGALFRFGAAAGNGSFQVAVWDNSGAGGAPGSTPIATTQVNLSTVIPDVQANEHSWIPFNPPVYAGENFYLGIILPTQSGDTLALVSNQDEQANPVNAWEQFSSGTWYNYADPSSWEIDIQQAIYPVMCHVAQEDLSAAFFADSTDIPQGFTVTFTDTSSGDVQGRTWEFPGGSPATSGDSIVQVTYNTAGTFPVSLAVSGSGGADTLTKANLVTVHAPPQAILQYSSLSTNMGGILSFNSSSLGDDLDYHWDFSGIVPLTSNDTILTAEFPDAGIYTISHSVSSIWGDPDTASVTVTVEGQLWGRLTYVLPGGPALQGIPVIFTDSLGNADSVYTNVDGYFGFSGLLAHEGSLKAGTAMPSPAGAVNSTDALQVLRHYVGLLNLSGLQLEAADVDNSGYTNSTDALKIAQYFTGMITAFPAGNWKSTMLTITPSGSAIRSDLQLIISGDVNASWVP